jgi:hypothetical protein
MGFNRSLADYEKWKHHNLVIPSEAWGQPVIGIGEGAFDATYSNFKLTNVTIPKSVTSIGDNAFANNQLKSVAFNNGVKSIGNNAFSGNLLTNVAIPQSVTSIGESAFANNQLKSVTIHDGVTFIGNRAFADNDLTGVIIPSSVSVIGESAFEKNLLAEITINTDSVHIGNNAFGYSHTYNIDRHIDRRFNEIMRITIVKNANMNVEYKSELTNVAFISESSSLPRNFIAYYYKNGKRAGTYHCSTRGEWVIDTEIKRRIAEGEKKEERAIRLGWRLITDFAYTSGGSSSEWFDINYSQYEDVGQSDWDMGGNLGIGLTLNVRILNRIVLATELNYAYMWNEFLYGKKGYDFAVMIATRNHTMNVPVLLRIGKRMGGYFEVGYQFGFPISSEIEVNTGGRFPYDKISESKGFSEYRVEKDEGIVFGFGGRVHELKSDDLKYSSYHVGFRFIYHLTKLDKDGRFKAPLIMGLTIAADVF